MNQKQSFCADGSPDYVTLKNGLGSLRGILEMNIDSRTGNVSVCYDDTKINARQLNGCMRDLGYHPAQQQSSLQGLL